MQNQSDSSIATAANQGVEAKLNGVSKSICFIPLWGQIKSLQQYSELIYIIELLDQRPSGLSFSINPLSAGVSSRTGKSTHL